MDAHKLQVKLFVEDGSAPPLESFIAVFHDWVKHHRLGELLVDVANYAHVPKGPGVALIGHASDYYIDEGQGRRGLLYSRKRDAPPPSERLADAFRRVLHAGLLLEQEKAFAGKIRFRRDEMLFRINDRLLAPNTEATYAAVKPELEAFCTSLFGAGAFGLAPGAHPRDLFSVRISTDKGTPLPALLDRLGGAEGL